MSDIKIFQPFEIQSRRIYLAIPLPVKNTTAGKLQTPEPFLTTESQIANSITWVEKVWRKAFFKQLA